LVIVAKSIEIIDVNGTISFSQDLEKLSAHSLRMVAKKLGCNNVGSLDKFQIRLLMAKKI
jgi:hypothetical protein